MTVSAELMTRLETERWTPLPEPTPLNRDVEQLLHRTIHVLAQAMNERRPA